MADLDEIDIFSPEERLQYGLAELPQQSDSSMLDYLPSRAQLGWFGSQLLPGAGVVDASGEMPGLPTGEQSAFAAENMPSMAENIDRGGWGYLDAGLQGLGVLGDAMYAIPAAGVVLGPTAGTILKGTGATGKAIRRGIASLPFTIGDLKKIFINEHPPVGSIDPNTGGEVTERLIQSRANRFEDNLGKRAVRRREEARAANQIEDLIPQERNILDPNDLYGHSLVPVAGDRSGIGTITDVNGVPLSFPVKVQGGPGYPQFMGEGKGWASMKTAAHQKQMNVIRAAGETGMPPLGVYTAMGREGINFSTPVALGMVGQLDFLRVPKKHISSFNAALRRGTPSNPGIKDFVGLNSPDLVPQLLGNIPSSVSAGNIRKSLVEEMKKPRWQNLGFPLYDDVVETVTNPQLRLARGPAGTVNPSETGYTIFKADPSQSTYRDPSHLSYDTVIPGDYLGGLTGRGAPPELLFPQNFARMQEKINIAGQPLTRQQQLGSLSMESMVEPVTDELIENLSQHLNRTYGTKYADGGPVAVKKYQNGGPVENIDIFADSQESPEAQTISQLVSDGRIREAYAAFEELPLVQQLAISVAPGIGDALAAYEVGEFSARARESMKSGSPLGATGNLAMSGLAGLSFIPMLRTLRVGRPLGKAAARTAPPAPAVASTSETIPGSSTGQLTGVTDLPADVRYQYSRDVYTDPNTGQMYQRDPFYEAMDMPQRDVFEGHGYYEGEFNPTFVSRPVPGTIPDAQGIPRIDPSDAKTIEQRDTTFGYLTQQEGTPTSRVLREVPAGTLDTIKITTDKSITQNQFKQIAEYAKQYGLDPISLPDGITFVNNKSFDVLEDLAPEIGDDLSRFISKTIGDPDMLTARGNFDTINYSSFADEFAEGAGELAGTSGAATRKLFQSLDDEAIEQLDNSADVRGFVINKLKVDLKIAREKNLPIRRDIITALTIISDKGFSGLKRVMEKGEVILPGILFLYLGRSIPMVLGETQPSEV
jgi:hypothetical protein